MPLDIFYPGNFNIHNRNFSEWSLHHWMNANQKPNLMNKYYDLCSGNIYLRAIEYGLRPEFAWELSDM